MIDFRNSVNLKGANVKNKSKLLLSMLGLVILSGVVFFFKYHFKDFTAREEKFSEVLNVYNWNEYIGKETIKNFEEKFGIKVNYKTFEDEEALFTALQSEPGKYDVVVASTELVENLIDARLLAEVDYSNIPNYEDVEGHLLNLSDERVNKVAVPYLWGTTGLIINTKHVQDESHSWSVLWDKNYNGKMAMLNNPYVVFHPQLFMKGVSISTNDLKILNEIGEVLIHQKPLLKGYLEPIEMRDLLVNEKLWAAQLYSGEALQAIEGNSNLKYFIPKEGGELWVDYWVIPRLSPHKRTAELFINYILEPKVIAKITDELWYANSNKASAPYINPEVTNNKSVYPDEEVLNRCQIMKVMGAPDEIEKSRSVINKYWTLLNRK